MDYSAKKLDSSAPKPQGSGFFCPKTGLFCQKLDSSAKSNGNQDCSCRWGQGHSHPRALAFSAPKLDYSAKLDFSDNKLEFPDIKKLDFSEKKLDFSDRKARLFSQKDKFFRQKKLDFSDSKLDFSDRKTGAL